MFKRIKQLLYDSYVKLHDTIRAVVPYVPLAGGIALKIAHPSNSKTLENIADPAIVAGSAVATASWINRRAERRYPGSRFKQVLCKATGYTLAANLANVILSHGSECYNIASALTNSDSTDSISTSQHISSSISNWERLCDGLKGFPAAALDNLVDTYDAAKSTFVDIYQNGFPQGLDISDAKQAVGLIGLTFGGLLIAPPIARYAAKKIKGFMHSITEPVSTYEQRRAKK